MKHPCFFTLCYSTFGVCVIWTKDTGSLERYCWRRQRHWAIKWKFMLRIHTLNNRNEKFKWDTGEVTKSKNQESSKPICHSCPKDLIFFSVFHMGCTLTSEELKNIWQWKLKTRWSNFSVDTKMEKISMKILAHTFVLWHVVGRTDIFKMVKLMTHEHYTPPFI